MPSLSRRAFIGTALAVPAVTWLGACADSDDSPDDQAGAAPADLRAWNEVRGLFDLDPETHHLSAYVLAPHSRPVRDAIEEHRRGLDRDPHGYLEATDPGAIAAVAQRAARHLDTDRRLIALTDSTTMGLGVLIGGMRFEPGDEILMTEHEHLVADQAAQHAAQRTGASVRKVRLYPPEAPERATTAGILSAIRDGIGAQTRLVLVTWVHSSTGVRLPVREIAEVVERANAGRAADDRALLVVDGVHGFGGGPTAVGELGCDGFVTGCHKWLLGPRGTGLAWARPALWARLTPIVPSFDARLFDAWIDGETATVPPSAAYTPGGYHSFEHRWALREAFDLHAGVGAERIAARVADLSDQLRDGLAGRRGIRVHAPAEERLRSGVVTFSVAGKDPFEVVDALADAHGVSATVTPYAVQLARLGTCWINTEDEVDAAIEAVRSL